MLKMKIEKWEKVFIIQNTCKNKMKIEKNTEFNFRSCMMHRKPNTDHTQHLSHIRQD